MSNTIRQITNVISTELQVDQKGTPHNYKAAYGNNQRLLNAPPIGLQFFFYFFRRRAVEAHSWPSVRAPRPRTWRDSTASRSGSRFILSAITGALGPITDAGIGAGSASEIGIRSGIHMIVWKRTHASKLGRKSRNYFATANLIDNERHRTHRVDFSVGRSR